MLVMESASCSDHQIQTHLKVDDYHNVSIFTKDTEYSDSLFSDFKDGLVLGPV